jgi:hypothetical protein
VVRRGGKLGHVQVRPLPAQQHRERRARLVSGSGLQTAARLLEARCVRAGQRSPAVPEQHEAGAVAVGYLTELADARFDDAAAIARLFQPDDTLPGRPIDALREDRGSEAKRRAQALGF